MILFDRLIRHTYVTFFSFWIILLRRTCVRITWKLDLNIVILTHLPLEKMAAFS